MLGLDVAVPQTVLRRVDQLIPYERNSRTHSAKQVAQLEALLLEFGWTNPVLVDDKGIVAGHGRCMAATNIYRRGDQIRFPGGDPIPIGYVPTLDCSGWSAEKRKAYIIADNRSALSAGWDEEALGLELRALEDAGYDLALTAFDEEELAELLTDVVELPSAADPDAVPKPPEFPKTVQGDVWMLGQHRVCCGDATSIDDWDRLMAGEQADVAFIDPPYNVDLGRKNRLMDGAVGGKRSATGAIANDKMRAEDFRDLIAESYACLFAVMRAGTAVYVSHSDKYADVFRVELETAGFHYSQTLIWNKGQHVLGMADYQPSHEPILYAWKPGARHRWFGGRKQRTVLEMGEGGAITRLDDGRWAVKAGDRVLIVSGEATVEDAPGTVLYEPKPAVSGLHPSAKPVALISRLLSNNARAGHVVVDAFGGSGSTLIAADSLAMSARVMELDPVHVDTIIQRWEHFSGKRAIHAVTGKPFTPDPEATEDSPPPADPAGLEDLF